MKLRITCLFWGFFASFLIVDSFAKSVIKSKSLVAGKSQVEAAFVWNTIIADGKLGKGIFTDKFDARFRPPTQENNPEDGEPTQVDLSLNSFRITEINETSQTLKFTANLVTEYADKRLQFDEDILSRRPTATFVPIPDFIPLWSPSMKFIQESNTLKVFNPSNNQVINPFSTRYLSPQGRVYNAIPVTAELTTKSEEDERNKVFSFDIIALKDTIEDVQFRWRSENPLNFESQEVDTEFGTYSVQPTLEKCKKLEDFGSFVGQQEFSCLRITLSLILEKDATVKIQIPRIPYP